MHVLRVFDPVTLQRAEIVAIAEFAEQIFQDRPVAITAGGAVIVSQMGFDIRLQRVVIEQCVVDIDQKDNPMRRGHLGRMLTGASLARHGRID